MTVTAVLGGGHQGCATAGSLALAGDEVRLWRRDVADFGRLAEERVLTVLDASGSRDARLALVTDDLAAALRGADRVVVAVPGFAHVELARAAAPHLEHGLPVLCTPGNLGSLEWARAGALAGETPHPIFGARKRGDTTVAVAHPTIRLPFAAVPAARTAEAIEHWSSTFPQLLPATDVVDVALSNPNPVVHPALVVTNAGAIEAFERYDLHAAGTTAATRRVIDEVDAERVAVREACGYGAPHWEVATLYDSDRQGEGFFPAKTFDSVNDSGDWNEPLTVGGHRYLEEDAAVALVVWSRFARARGVPVPTIDSVLAVAGAMVDRDLHAGTPHLRSADAILAAATTGVGADG